MVNKGGSHAGPEGREPHCGTTKKDAKNVVYRQNCNFIWNNDKDTLYLYKASGSRADVHACTKKRNDSDGNGYITYHG